MRSIQTPAFGKGLCDSEAPAAVNNGMCFSWVVSGPRRMRRDNTLCEASADRLQHEMV